MIFVVASLKKELSDILLLSKKIGKRKERSLTFFEIELEGKRIVLVKSGIGNKGILDEKMFGKCSILISTGFCGALISELKTGSIVVSDEILTIDKNDYSLLIRDGINYERIPLKREKLKVDNEVVEVLKESMGNGISINKGPTFTSPKIAKNEIEKKKINSLTGAVSVDMEDWYRCQFSKRIGARFLSVRAVLDEISDDVPGFKDGLKIGYKIAGIISKIGYSQQSIALAVSTLVKSID